MAVEVRIPTLAGGLIKSSTIFSFVVAFFSCRRPLAQAEEKTVLTFQKPV
jgi:hypothetical protein